MSRPIKETPVLRGKDARRFMAEVERNLRRDHSEEYRKALATYKRLARRWSLT